MHYFKKGLELNPSSRVKQAFSPDAKEDTIPAVKNSRAFEDWPLSTDRLL